MLLLLSASVAPAGVDARHVLLAGSVATPPGLNDPPPYQPAGLWRLLHRAEEGGGGGGGGEGGGR